jgi:hypothetical protein
VVSFKEGPLVKDEYDEYEKEERKRKPPNCHKHGLRRSAQLSVKNRRKEEEEC